MLMLQRDGIAAGVVQTAEDLYRDPHLRERGFARDVYLPQVGWLTRAGPSVRMTDMPFAPKNEAHLAGEDNEAVFGELLGLSKEKIAEMTEQGVLR
jgi:crotonobetainyl-CoA:carnitine CoA-transferase CaiB-like acyl-CoA transferase